MIKMTLATTLLLTLWLSMYMLPRPALSEGIDISRLTKGMYLLQLTDEKTKMMLTKKFVKQ